MGGGGVEEAGVGVGSAREIDEVENRRMEGAALLFDRRDRVRGVSRDFLRSASRLRWVERGVPDGKSGTEESLSSESGLRSIA